MIFVTVGTQLPFDRLIQTLDEWVGNNELEIDIFAQIGDANYKPKNFPFKDFIDTEELEKKHFNSDFIIAHAGMGSILTALKHKKPIVTLPRLAKFNEHRNDHQLATTKQLEGTAGLYVAQNEQDLINSISMLLENSQIEIKFSDYASDELLNKLSNFIDDI